MLNTIKQYQKNHGTLPNITELARLLGITRNTVYKRLSDLEREGEIERTPVQISAGYRLK
jgi:DNA-binding IclR family transcriptional regulator